MGGQGSAPLNGEKKRRLDKTFFYEKIKSKARHTPGALLFFVVGNGMLKAWPH